MMSARAAFVRATALGLAVVLSLLATVIFGVTPASAEDDLLIESDTEFMVNLEASALDVEAVYRLTNDKPPTVTESSTEDFFFTNFAFLALAAATDLTVIVDGEVATLDRSVIRESRQFELVTVELPERLAFGESMTAVARYTIPNGDARSSDPVRVSSSYLAFPVYACCDPGKASLRIEIPSTFGLDLTGDDPGFVRRTIDGRIVLEVTELGDPQAVNTFIFGRNDAELVLTNLEVDGNAVEIQSWPDDPDWADFVSQSLTDTIPALEDLIGVPWPLGKELRIVQTATPYLFGYAGWYNHQGAVIEMGEQLNDQALAHEVSHVWLSDDLFDSHWINEGLAEFFAQEAIRLRGGLPVAPVVDPATGLFAQPLNQWQRPVGEATIAEAERERYGYASSWYVMETVAEQIGVLGLADVLAAARNGEISYAAGDVPETDPEAWTSWQRFMDLVQERGEWDGVENLFRERVVTAEDSAMLEVRARARDRYRAFAAETAGWQPPLGVRSAMTTWTFSAAVEQMDAAAAIFGSARRDIVSLATELELPVLPQVRTAYEASRSLEDLVTTEKVAGRQRQSLETIRDVTQRADEPQGWRTRLGLRGKDIDAQLAEIRAAYEADDAAQVDSRASELTQVLNDAADAGQRTAILVAVIVVAALAALLTLFGNRLRRER